MTSLTSCLKKLDKVLSSDDVAVIKSAYDDHRGDGIAASEAAIKAVDEVLADVLAERDQMAARIEKAGGQAPAAPEFSSPETPDGMSELFEDFFADPENRFKTITDARKYAKENGFSIIPGQKSAKDMEEAMELALVRVSRRIIESADSPQQAYDDLVSLNHRQPKLGQRTSKSMVDQAYSTPVPLAYLAQNLAGINAETRVYEPTAGNGSLLTSANPELVVANELDTNRVANLKAQGFFRVTNNRLPSAQPGIVRKHDMADVVVMNPPFGAVKGRDGKSQKFTLPKFTTTQIDHAIALNALEAMPADGQAVMIVGSVNKKLQGDKARGDAYNSSAKRKFYFHLYNQYNVVDHFTVDGSLYEKQGAGWPVDVIVVNGEGKSSLPLPAVTPPPVLKTWDELKGKLRDGDAISSGAGRREPGQVREPDIEALVDPAERDAGRVEEGSGSLGAPVQRSEPAEPDGGRAVRSPSDVRERSSDGQRNVQVRKPGTKSGLRSKLESRKSERRGRASAEGDAGQSGIEPAQRDYLAASNEQSLNTLTPTNMQTSAENALVAVEDTHGNVDAFVERELAYEPGTLGQYFGAEQIDALALAINEIKRGKAFINGDQTGIGKGRVMAGVMRYAMVQGQKPVLFTEAPNLYGDMFRDLNDIGIQQYLGRGVNAMMTNVGEFVPVDQEALDWYAEKLEAEAEGKKAPPQRGQIFKGMSKKKTEAAMQSIIADGMGDFDIIFTTYNQMNTQGGQDTPRRAFIRAIAPTAIYAFDESHNAFGTQNEAWKAKGATPDRATMIRQVTQEAAGVVFSSATYAKRPDGMDLYARTDLGDAVENPKDLGAVIMKGGVPMQQVIASMIAESGQYVRRERSFAGIDYSLVTAAVSEAEYDAFSQSLAAIVGAEGMLKADPNYDNWIDQLKEEGAGTARDSGVGETGITSSNFTSIMHNVIDQFLLGLKAEAAADAAIARIEKGEKPVLTVSKTNEAFLRSYAEERQVQIGQKIGITFADAVKNYLDRTRQITVRHADEDRKAEQRSIPLDMLSQETIDAYNAADEQIAKIAQIPASPIDFILDRIERAGHSVGEITGRRLRLRYNADGTTTLDARDSKMIGVAGRRVTLNKFNNGDIDVMVLNRAGSTGLSAHASSTFKDQKPRHMIIVQPEGNIDTHMQLLGRINRTGQVVLPGYSQLIADVPAEARPAAVLAKKMASLNANTTAARKSAVSSDAIDFLNIYGDQVVAKVLDDNYMWSQILMPGGINKDTLPDISRKATGRLTLLPVAQQREFLEQVETQYAELIEMKDRLGENELEAKFVDLQAEILETDELKPREGDSPFLDAVYMNRVLVKAVGKSMTSQDIAKAVAEAAEIDVAPTVERTLETASLKAMKYGDGFMDLVARQREWEKEHVASYKTLEAKEKARKGAKKLTDRFNQIRYTLRLGEVVNVVLGGEEVPAIVIGKEDSQRAKTPMALSNHRVKLAVPTQSREINLRFNNVILESDTRDADAEKTGMIITKNRTPVSQVLSRFDEASKEAREERYIITGNIVSGFDMAGGRGRIMNFTDNQGNVQPGVLMSPSFERDMFMKSRPIRFKETAHLFEFMDQTERPEVTSTDGLIAVLKVGPNEYEIELPKARSSGGRYFLQTNVREAANDDFNAVGDRMRFRGTRQKAIDVLNAMTEHGALFQTNSDQELAQSIIRGEPAPDPDGPPAGALKQKTELPRAGQGRLTNKATSAAPKMAEDLMDIARQLMGHDVDLRLYDQLEQEGQISGAYFNNVVWMAMAVADDPVNTLSHEAIHQLRDSGMFTPVEWRILMRHSRDEWMERYKVRGLYEDDYNRLYGAEAEEKMLEEGIAQAFADYFTGKTFSSGRVSAILTKLKSFLDAVRNYLAGQGFRTASDIFANVKSGKVAARKPSVDPQTDTAPAMASNRPHYQFRDRMGEPQGRSFTPPVDMSVVEWVDRSRPLLNRIARSVHAFLADPIHNSTAMRRVLQDRFIDVKRYQEAIEKGNGEALAEHLDTYQAESLYYGITGQRLDDLRNDRILPLIEEASRRGLSKEDIDLYLYARHAPERNTYIASINDNMPDGGSGMTNEEAFEILETFQRKGKTADLEAISGMVQDMLEDTRKTLLKSGLIDRQTYDQWSSQYANYVPLRGWENDPEADTDPQRLSIGRKFDVRGKEAHPAYGRRTRADSPLAFIIAQSQQAIVRAEKNRVGKTFLRMVQNNPNKTVWEVNKDAKKRALKVDPATGMASVRDVADSGHKLADNVYAVKVGGVQNYITLHDPNLATALKGMGNDQLKSGLQYMAAANRYLSWVNTALNPEFVISNFVRDLQTAVIHLSESDINGIRSKVLKDVMTTKALRGAFRGLGGHTDTEWSRHFRDYADHGGKISFFNMEDIETIKRKIDNDLKDVSPSGSRKILNVAKGARDMIERVNMAVENGVRLATYVELVNAGVSKPSAASAARELTVNFNRKGTAGPVINAAYLFYNAGIQGNVNVAKRMVRSRKIQKIALGIVVFSAALDMLNRMVAEDDEDGKNLYDKIPFYEKERNFIIMVPSWMRGEGAPKGEYIKFPTPWVYNIFKVAGSEASSTLFGASTPMEGVSRVTGTVFNSFNPIGGGATPLSIALPTLLDPLGEIYTNQNWYGAPLYPHEYDLRRPKPDSQRHFSNVNPASKAITDKLNELTGGDTVRGGDIDVSPATLDHLWNFATGGAGAFVSRTTTAGSKLFSGDEIEVKDIPFARRVVGRKSQYWDNQLYYEIADSVLVTEKQIKVARQSGQGDYADRLQQEYSTERRMIPLVKRAENQLRQLRKIRRAVLAKPKTEARERRLDSLRDRQQQIMLKVRKKYYQLEKAR